MITQEVQTIRDKPRTKLTMVPNPPPAIIPIEPPIITEEIALQTIIPQQSDSGTDNDEIQVGQVIKTKTPSFMRVINKNYNKLKQNKNNDDDDSQTESPTKSETSDEYEKPTKSITGKKKKHKNKTKFDDEITETITDITKTVNDTIHLVGKNVLIEIVQKVAKSKQFMIILILVTIFGGIGWLLRIVYGK